MMKMPPLALLAGGLATRLRPLTETFPKSLIEVAGEPFIAHQLRLLQTQGIENVVICAGFLAEKIQNFVGNGAKFGLSVKYSIDGEPLLGTGGAIFKALPLLDNEFFIMYGDSYLTTDFGLVLDAFRSKDRSALMTVFRNNGQWDTSNIEFEAGKIKRYDKKNLSAHMKYIDYGLGIVKRDAFIGYTEGQPFDLSSFYQKLLSQGQVTGFEVHTRFYETGSVSGIAETEKYLLSILSNVRADQ